MESSCRLSVVGCRLARRGISLIEVLASIGVLSIGILALAVLLPVGRVTIAEATKADRTGDCGRAALRNVIVRRMLDTNYWSTVPTNAQSVIIDPRGVLNGMNAKFGNAGTSVPRISLKYINNTKDADEVFMCKDDLIVTLPEELRKPQPVGRPQNPDAMGNPFPLDYRGDLTWFLTVTPVPNTPTRFTASVVVCFKRDVTAPTAERAVNVKTFFDRITVNGVGVALGGGSIDLDREINDTQADVVGNTAGGIDVRENDWVALCSGNGLCRWYRVAAVGDDSSKLTLIGPDWFPAAGDKLVALGRSVSGVYTTVVDLDTDPTWRN
jgi:type II secretory pathway pseudopilin PulG